MTALHYSNSKNSIQFIFSQKSFKFCIPSLKTPQPLLLQIQQQLEGARALIIGLLMDIVMMTITTWTAVMMAETVADATLTRSTALFVDVLIQMEVSVEQHAHKQQQAQQQA